MKVGSACLRYSCMGSTWNCGLMLGRWLFSSIFKMVPWQLCVPHVCIVVTLVAEDGFAMTNSGKHISLPASLSDGDPVEWF